MSLSLVSGASAAAAGPTANPQTPNVAASHEITLREEEIFDVSLATFYVFDKEDAAMRRPGPRLAFGGCGGCGGCAGLSCNGCSAATDYAAPATSNFAPPSYSTRPARKSTRAPKNP